MNNKRSGSCRIEPDLFIFSFLFLILIIYLDYDDAYRLVAGVICYLGDVPVSRKEDEEFAGSAVEETGLAAVVIIMNYVGTILAVGGDGNQSYA